MPECKQSVEIQNELGLHTRAATVFVQLASKYSCDVFIQKDGQEVSGKSIMGVLMLVAAKGTIITVRCSGEQADEACAALIGIVNDKFGEAK